MHWLFWVSIVAVACVAICLYLFLPERLAASWTADPRREAADRYRQAIATGLGGFAVFATFVWTLAKDRETLQQASDQEADLQYVEAAKMLGDGRVPTRAAAIYALGNLATTRPALYSPIRETMVDFLRVEPPLEGDPSDGHQIFHSVDGAAQAAITVLGRRDPTLDDARWPLRLDGAHLDGADFHHLKGFSGANMKGVRAHGTDFRCADLHKASFEGAEMSDYQSYIDWDDTVADGGSWEDWRKYRFITNFEGANLAGTQFQGAALAGAKFADADLAGADFSRANLSRADFAGARNVEKAIFHDEQGRACADVQARFDNPEIELPACLGSSAAVLPHTFLKKKENPPHGRKKNVCLDLAIR